MHAAHVNDFEVVRTCLHVWKVHPDAISGGYTALVHACTQGHTEMAKYLIEQNAKVDGLTAKGLNPLHHVIAAEKNRHVRHMEVMRMLMKENSDIQLVCKGYAPVHRAALLNSEYEAMEYLKLLMSRHADLTQRTDKDGFTPLHIACRRHHKHVIGVLLGHDSNQSGTYDRG